MTHFLLPRNSTGESGKATVSSRFLKQEHVTWFLSGKHAFLAKGSIRNGDTWHSPRMGESLGHNMLTDWHAKSGSGMMEVKISASEIRWQNTQLSGRLFCRDPERRSHGNASNVARAATSKVFLPIGQPNTGKGRIRWKHSMQSLSSPSVVDTGWCWNLHQGCWTSQWSSRF